MKTPAEFTPAEIQRWRTASALLPDGGQEAVNVLLDVVESLTSQRDNALADVARLSRPLGGVLIPPNEEIEALKAEVVSLRSDLANTARGIAPFNGTEFALAMRETERATVEAIAGWIDEQAAVLQGLGGYDNEDAADDMWTLAREIRGNAWRKEDA